MELEVITRRPKGKARPVPLLCVHGMTQGAWCWDEHFLPYFAEQGYHASALSLRGHGQSPNDRSLRLTRIAHYVQDVKQVAAALEAETGRRPVIIGHSMGGFITQKLLEHYEAPAAVLVASPPTHGMILVTLRTLVHRPWTFTKIILTLRLRPLVETPANVRWAFFSDSFPDADLQRYNEQMTDDSFMAFLDMLLLNLPRPGRVKSPVLVLAPANDHLISPAEQERTARAYGAECVTFPDMGHGMMLETGWQAVAEKTATWLDARGI